MLKKYLYATAALAMTVTASNASIVSYSTTVQEIAKPAHVGIASPANNEFILAFNETQRFTLTSALMTNDGGTIAAGTKIDSHMVLLNKTRDRTHTLDIAGDITFSGAILGLITLRNTLLASDYLGGLTIYDDYKNRGLDEAKLDTVSFTDDKLTAHFFVNNPGDWIRVISVAEVPVPAGAALLPMGLAALAGLRRRRKAAAKIA